MASGEGDGVVSDSDSVLEVHVCEGIGVGEVRMVLTGRKVVRMG